MTSPPNEFDDEADAKRLAGKTVTLAVTVNGRTVELGIDFDLTGIFGHDQVLFEKAAHCLYDKLLDEMQEPAV
jgi:hypothetical protein